MSLVDGAQDLPKTPALIVDVGAARWQERQWRGGERVRHPGAAHAQTIESTINRDNRPPQPQPAEHERRSGASFESARHLRVP